MPNVRMMPPVSGNLTITLPSGRKYTGVVGTPSDVPDFDAAVLGANGWTVSGAASGGSAVQVGATAARPTNPQRGMLFNDTTVGAIIQWDGATWRHATTHASV